MSPDLEFRPDESLARELDAADPLRGLRDRFHRPLRPDGSEALYFAGNSLGLQPRGVAAALDQELDDWARLGVDAHFHGTHPWYSYHEPFREPCARLVGAQPSEVVLMNGLTTNLHLMLVSFYRPGPERRKILMEPNAFPSDTYAVETQLRFHGVDPHEGLLLADDAGASPAVDEDRLERLIEREGDSIALVLLGGVNYYTGQAFDLRRIARAARRKGCVLGLDLAHAVGNIELALHEWEVDFAVWCSYKYLNGGPGAVAGCFVHERHHRDTTLPRFAGWWGNDPADRFRMHLQPEFRPVPSADAWQLSNPPILALAPLRVSLRIFDEAGMSALRVKSRSLTAYLESWVAHAAAGRMQLLTPREPRARGCQLSFRVRDRPRRLFEALQAAGVVGDFREPDVIRLAPVPLYNSFHDVWRLGNALLRIGAA